jgi:hypothetical protein
MSLVVTHWPGEPGLAGEEGVATQGGLSSRNERRRRRRRVVGGLGRCERKWVEKKWLKRRVCAMSLLLWLAVECVLLGAAVGHRPLKDTRVLELDNSLWLNEVYMCVGEREREKCSAVFCYLCTIATISWFPCFVGAEVVHRGGRRACSGALQHAEYHRNIQG